MMEANDISKNTMCDMQISETTICGRQIWDQQNSKCIFHSPKIEEKMEVFKRELTKYIADIEKNAQIESYDFREFVFGNVNFQKKIFLKPVDFTGSTFKYQANFSESEFREKANFSICEFNHSAIFTYCTFNRSSDFVGAKFQQIDLTASKFQGEVFFIGCKFLGQADFTACEFSKDVNLRRAQFHNYADFSYVHFKGNANFNEVAFEKVDFRKMEFSRPAMFMFSTFDNLTNFKECSFKDIALFRDSIINNQLVLEECKFNSIADFSFLKFHHELGQILIVKSDLNQPIFLLSNPHKLNIDFPKLYRIKYFVAFSRQALYDEVLLRSLPRRSDYLKLFEDRQQLLSQENLRYDSVESHYRLWKRKFEDDRNFPEAGDFHIGEMEMKRLAPKKYAIHTLFHRILSFTALYKYASYYGENYILPLLWVIIGLFLFSLLFLFSGLSPAPNSPYHSFNYDLKLFSFPSFSQLFDDFTSSLIYTLRIFSFQREGLFTPQNKWGHFWAVLARAYSPAMLALFLLALRRRFKR